MASTSKKNESSVLFDQPGPKGLRTIRIANIIAAVVFAVVLVLILMRLAAPPDGENQLEAGSCGSRRWRPRPGPTSTCPACG